MIGTRQMSSYHLDGALTAMTPAAEFPQQPESGLSMY